MANQLKMADIQCIITLHGRGWSRRRIARELGMDRETVARHLRLSAELVCDGGTAGSKPATSEGIEFVVVIFVVIFVVFEFVVLFLVLFLVIRGPASFPL